MKITPLTALRLMAVMVLCVGLVWTATTLRHNVRLERKMGTIRETLSQLAELRQIGGQHQRILSACEDWATNTPASILAIARANLKPADAQPTVGELEQQILFDGWTVQKAEVVFAEVEFSQLAQFLYAAETQRPPWRLTECTLVSSHRQDAAGRATLIMETLLRSSRKRAADQSAQ